MAETVPVRCPACHREHAYAPPVFPCACGTPIAPPLVRGATLSPITHRNWTDAWVAVRCPACGREDEWPQPEFGCGGCGTVARIPVRPVSEVYADTGADPGAVGTSSSGGAGARPATTLPAHIPLPPTAAVPRPAFQPVTIRTARDAVTAAALYLRWLGFRDVRQSDKRPSSGIDLRAPGLVAQVDPSTRPAALRDIECLWLNGLTTSAVSVFFSLAGYTAEARTRADDLRIPLFVMDLTGVPQPVNDPADELLSTGA
ncbi:hypothetical protein [Streptomyces sp. NPDC051219]|uniref:hypothetical protein n=1 Tax=Streptomyces sp. NPDC051219 TaxID=3155283 RepID=UPI00341B226D